MLNCVKRLAGLSWSRQSPIFAIGCLLKNKPRCASWAGNYGEAGAINLYGPAYGLPVAISGVNSFWLRGYGDAPPQIVIVVGFARSAARSAFATCDLAGHNTNRDGVVNEETRDHPYIFICPRAIPALVGDLEAPSELWMTPIRAALV